ncbi:MAG: TadE/TadG family type IV pilus assembly protein [Sphingopyxis sp.]|jgi:Flp pilus assembly protein TadG|uniref:TadE/TadG family type IV pilus assembly protein n=1 Tax=Sphingopyxis sp. TaxID=1908224 RepID=UPI003D6C751D
MKAWRSLWSDTHAGPAAEFALVLPLILLFLFGIIDVGRYVWEVNRAEKATQTGARRAAVTALIPSGLATYSFAVSGGVPAGGTVSNTAFPGVSCSSAAGTVSCACSPGGTCGWPSTVNTNAFTALVARMDDIKADITADDVVVDYSWSGLGFAGDPNGPDVVPIITVRLRNQEFRPFVGILFNGAVSLPDFSYSLTMEDGADMISN